MSARRQFLHLAILATVTACTGCGADSANTTMPSPSLEAAQTFSGFPLYMPGRRVDSQPLTYAGEDEIENIRRGSGRRVIFSYGRCTPTRQATESTCTYPITVENWPICDRYPASHSAAPERTWVHIGGATAVVYETDGTQFAGIDVFARGTTISIVADKATSLSIAGQLVRVNGPSAGHALEPYRSGFADGKPRICS